MRFDMPKDANIEHVKFLRSLVDLLKQAGVSWFRDNAPRCGAALAFYTLFSITPVLIIVIALTGTVFGDQLAHREILRQFQSLIGPPAASSLDTAFQAAAQSRLGRSTSLLAFVALFAGASGAFNELQDALNTIWKSDGELKGAWIANLKHRLFSIGLVIATGFLLLLSVVIAALRTGAEGFLSGQTTISPLMLGSVNFMLSFFTVTVLFALIFKFVPDTVIHWRDVLMGSAVAALLFTGGKAAIGAYVGHSRLSSASSAGASLVVFLLWIYYSAQIMLFGAELTNVYALRFGSRRKSAAAKSG
jgi:membrane protein